MYAQGIDRIVMLEQADVLDYDSDQDTTEATRSYYHRNALGSVMEITDPNEATGVSYRYDPYGKVTITRGGQTQNTDPLGQHWTFTARFHDEETGLYYYRARYYDPGLGRFLQRDPAEYRDSPNHYEYCRSSSVNYVDATARSAPPPYSTQNRTPDWLKKLGDVMRDRGYRPLIGRSKIRCRGYAAFYCVGEPDHIYAYRQYVRNTVSWKTDSGETGSVTSDDYVVDSDREDGFYPKQNDVEGTNGAEVGAEDKPCPENPPYREPGLPFGSFGTHDAEGLRAGLTGGRKPLVDKIAGNPTGKAALRAAVADEKEVQR